MINIILVIVLQLNYVDWHLTYFLRIQILYKERDRKLNIQSLQSARINIFLRVVFIITAIEIVSTLTRTNTHND